MAQEDTPTDFELLMAGKVVELDWGDGVVWGDDPLTETMPPAAQLIAKFIRHMAVADEDERAIEYGITKLLLEMSPSLSFYGNEPWYGTAVSTLQWDEETMTLTAQTTQYLRPDPLEVYTREDGVEVWVMGHNWGCSGGMGYKPTIWWTTCMAYEDHVGGELMPVTTTYRMGVFTVAYLPPTD